MTFFPAQIIFGTLLMSETVFTAALSALALGGVLLFARARGRDGVLGWLGWGMAAGAATLIRAEGAVLVVVPALAAASRREWRRAAAIASAAALGAALALAPWVWRNLRVAGAFVPTSASLGRTLLIGHNPAARGGMMAIEGRPGEPPPRAARDEVDLDRRMTRAALDFARQNPGRELGLVPRKVFHLFRGDHEWIEFYGPRSPVPPRLATMLGRLSNLYYGGVLLLGAVGWIAWWRSPRADRRVVQLIVVCWVAVFALIYGSPRFHHPLMPLFCVMAAHVLAGGAARERPA
jgi:4-amino-4-deoxy-L-arabinose transferase-like glycosyltransferase